VLAAVAAYLLGSLSFAVIVSRVMGLKDPRSYGSNNPGATNVLRSGSKKAAIATLLLDRAVAASGKRAMGVSPLAAIVASLHIAARQGTSY
jgi:glycerol-3-phosphate acyltransferase PlsY